MTSGVENQCIDPSSLVSDEESYYASIESSPEESVEVSECLSVEVDAPPSTLHAERSTLDASPAYSGAQCTPDTYVDATDFIPAKARPLISPSPLGERAGVRGSVASQSPIAILGAACFLCGCAPVGPGANPNGDGGFDFGDDDAGTDERTDVRANDSDNDGYPEDMDCDDNDATVHPRAEETPYDGIDQDCNGEDLIDADGDGFIASQAGGNDCNDDQAYIHPGAEQRLTGFDTNCDDSLEIDLDRDSVKFVGENDGDRLGTSMAMGDVNGDGYDDVVVGTSEYGAGHRGRVYIFLGGAETFAPGTTLNAEDADVKITGGCAWLLGASLVTKDLNDDGISELIIGVPGLNSTQCEPPDDVGDGSRSGGLHVFEGRSTWDSAYDFSDIDIGNTSTLAANQLGIIKGATGGRIGRTFLVTGDMDGDGVGEIVAGRGSQCDVIPARVYEGINRIDEVRDSEGGYHIHNSTGTPFNGTPCDHLASGDMNGDGLADLVLGDADDVLGLHDGAGRIVALFGSEFLPSDINLFSLETYSGLKYLPFSGNGPSYAAGSSLAVGDVDGDGKDELMIGVSGEDNMIEGSGMAQNSGRVYCVPGTAITDVIEGDNPFFENGDLVVLDGDVIDLGGVSFYATVANANLPTALAVANTSGDAAGSLLIGVAGYGGFGGRTFYFGSSAFDGGSLSREVSVEEATVDMGIPVRDSFGARLTGGGDPNGDGVEDVMIAAPTAPDRTDRGNVYLLLGGAR